MSALPRIPHAEHDGYAGLRMTAEEFFAIGETEGRYELIDGVVVMSPSPSPRHQKVIRIVMAQIERAMGALPPRDQAPGGAAADGGVGGGVETSGGELFPETDVRLGPGIVYRPDLIYYRPGRIEGLPDLLTMAPDLAVEILSPGGKARDLVTKLADYGRFGIGEYWVIDPVTGKVRCWRRGTSRAGTPLTEVQVEGDRLPSDAVPGFTLDLRALRALAG